MDGDDKTRKKTYHVRRIRSNTKNKPAHKKRQIGKHKRRRIRTRLTLLKQTAEAKEGQ